MKGATAAVQRKCDRALLFVLLGPQQGAVFKLTTPSVSIGCSELADVELRDDRVSGRHARLTLRADGASIEDLGSLNGTFVNDLQVHGPHPLTDGDHLRCGPSTVLKFKITDKLEELALTTLFALTLRDPLTRLYNRRYFDDRLRSELSFALRHGTLLALLLIDIDHFGEINNEHGHPIGDVVLKLVAGSVERVMRPEDVLSRFGGDELVAILRATSLRNAEIFAQRICHRIAALRILPDERLRLTVSVGAAAMGPGGTVKSADTLLAAADKALYRAKAAGRNCAVACHVDPDETAQAHPPRRRHTQPPKL